MKSKKNQREPQPSTSTVEDKAAEKLKESAQDSGLIVNAGEASESEAKKKAISRWENEGGAVLPQKKGGKK